MNNAPALPRPAATLILLRDDVAGLEVLMVRRTQLAEFAGGAYVFPGGALDGEDRGEALAGLCHGLDDAGASAVLGVSQGGLGYWTAAVRETFEEAGLLMAYDATGQLATIGAHNEARYDAARRTIAEGKAPLHDFLRHEELRVAADQLHYFSHWITQAGRPRRYDTRFFIARAPAKQQPSHDGSELVDHLWIAPAEALARNRRGEFNLLFPTLKTLEALSQWRTVEAAIHFARTPRAMPTMEPRAATGSAGKRLLVPGDHAYAEVGKLDPGLSGNASYEIVPGAVVSLSTRVRRLTAPNPGMMTGPGTNTYLIGDAASGIAVIDPGPADERHVAAIVQAAGGAIRWILCTHTHRDHSPGAALLKVRTGAALYGMRPRHTDYQDDTFLPDISCGEGDVYSIAGCMIRVLHTPGHASNQLCFLLQEEGLLFTGDHIMQGSTVVINPPDGDMRAYFASLERLQTEPLEWLAPGHGFLMGRPHEMVERLLVHRRSRENKIINALRPRPGATVDALVPAAYDDTPAPLHALAARSLLAHLLKLEGEGRVNRKGDFWTFLQ